jgi:hypothetical protein
MTRTMNFQTMQACGISLFLRGLSRIAPCQGLLVPTVAAVPAGARCPFRIQSPKRTFH